MLPINIVSELNNLMNSNGIVLKHRCKIGLVLAALSVMAVVAYLLIKYDLFHMVVALINENTPAELFIPMLVFLPLVGVPLTFFLLLLGLKFGVLNGLFLLEAIIPIQILIAYLLAIGVRKPIENFLVNRKNYQIPQIPEHKAFIFSFLLLMVPLFPYSVKLYILPLAGVKFRYCFWLNWALQGMMCIPFVVLGKSAADLNFVMFGVTVLVIVALYFFLHWAQKQYATFQKEKIS